MDKLTREYKNTMEVMENHNKRFIKAKNSLIELLEDKESLRTTDRTKLLVNTVNAFIDVYSNKKIKVYENFSIKHFTILLKACENYNDFSCSIHRIHEVIKDSKIKVVFLFSPISLQEEEEDIKLFGDDEDKEMWKEQLSKMKKLHNDIKYHIAY